MYKLNALGFILVGAVWTQWVLQLGLDLNCVSSIQSCLNKEILYFGPSVLFIIIAILSLILDRKKNKLPALNKVALSPEIIVQEVKVVAKKRHEDALTVIEYSKVAAKAWREAQELPMEQQEEFLDKLDLNPKGDAEALLKSIKDAYYATVNHYDNQEANDAFALAKTIGEDVVTEFERVYDLMGDTIQPMEILEKIVSKFYGALSAQSVSQVDQALLGKDYWSLKSAWENMGYSISSSNQVLTRPNGTTAKVKTLQDLLTFTEMEKELLSDKLNSISRTTNLNKVIIKKEGKNVLL